MLSQLYDLDHIILEDMRIFFKTLRQYYCFSFPVNFVENLIDLYLSNGLAEVKLQQKRCICEN